MLNSNPKTRHPAGWWWFRCRCGALVNFKVWIAGHERRRGLVVRVPTEAQHVAAGSDVGTRMRVEQIPTVASRQGSQRHMSQFAIERDQNIPAAGGSSGAVKHGRPQLCPGTSLIAAHQAETGDA